MADRVVPPPMRDSALDDRPAAGWDALAGLSAGPDAAARSAASDAAVYTLGVYSAQALLFVAGLIQKGLLGPLATGFWALMATIYSFFGLSSLGTFHGAVRQIPTYRGRSEFGAAAAVANTAGSVSVLAMAVLGLTVAVFALVLGDTWASELRYGLVLLGLTAPLRAFADGHELVLQATKRFPVLSLTLVVKAAVGLVLQTLLVYFLGFYGMFAGLVAVTTAALLFWRRKGLAGRRTPAFRFEIRRSRIRELIPIGIPILVYSQIWLLFVSIDSLIVARFIDVENLGFYALAVSVTNYILFLPNSIAIALFPRMQERFAPTREIQRIRHYVTDVQSVLAFAFVPAFVGGAFFALPVLVRHALPAFEPSIEVVQIMVAGSFCIALVHMPIELMITTGHRWNITALLLACLGINSAANYIAVAILDEGVEGAAVATAISYLVLFLATTVYGVSKAVGARTLIRHVGVLLFVFGYTVAVLWGLELLIGGSEDLGGDLARALGKSALFAVAATPWLFLAQRRYGALSTLWRLVRAGLAQARPSGARASR